MTRAAAWPLCMNDAILLCKRGLPFRDSTLLKLYTRRENLLVISTLSDAWYRSTLVHVVMLYCSIDICHWYRYVVYVCVCVCVCVCVAYHGIPVWHRMIVYICQGSPSYLSILQYTCTTGVGRVGECAACMCHLPSAICHNSSTQSITNMQMHPKSANLWPRETFIYFLQVAAINIFIFICFLFFIFYMFIFIFILIKINFN